MVRARRSVVTCSAASDRMRGTASFERVCDCLVYPSLDQNGRTKGVIHFIGGAFIGAAPDVIYRFKTQRALTSFHYLCKLQVDLQWLTFFKVYGIARYMYPSQYSLFVITLHSKMEKQLSSSLYIILLYFILFVS